MGATQFICPNGDKILINQCLRNCPHSKRCMAKPTLQALAHSVSDRGLGKYSVTELLRGTREVYLEKTVDYAVNPQDRMFALHGSSMHLVGEYNSDESIITELRLENSIYTGQIDAYGNILGNGKNILLDYKVSGAYKTMIALGYHQVDEETGEIYKIGPKKGQPKTRKVWKPGGIRKMFDWVVQVNAYRYLIEMTGHEVDEMYIQVFIRDFGPRVASENIITQPIYLIKVNRISDHWIEKYFQAKQRRLDHAMETGEIPAHCSNRECWNGRKCSDYCDMYNECQKYEQPNDVANVTNVAN